MSQTAHTFDPTIPREYDIRTRSLGEKNSPVMSAFSGDELGTWSDHGFVASMTSRP
jgi:hypothetical protein